MIALLHYAVLKTKRDGSLFVFLFAPGIVIAALLGPSIAELRLRYPLALSPSMTPLQNARLLLNILGAAALMFGTVIAFWTFRAEMATRAIAAFVVAKRAMTVVGTLILFATMTVVAAWVTGITAIVLLTATVPPRMFVAFVTTVVASLALSSIAALIVTVAPQPANLIWAYLSILIFLPWIEKLGDIGEFALAAAIVAVCAPLTTYFLRRRCAT